MEFSVEKFNKVKHEAEDFYSKIISVRCPYFEENVHFNAKGLEHLIFKEWNKTRLIADQFIRFKYLNLAPEVISHSKTLQGIWMTQKFERIKKKSGWQKVLKLTTFYEFIAIMEIPNAKIRIKIIVKQVEGGEKYFLSIIPYWGTNKINGERILFSGNPEND